MASNHEFTFQESGATAFCGRYASGGARKILGGKRTQARRGQIDVRLYTRRVNRELWPGAEKLE